MSGQGLGITDPFSITNQWWRQIDGLDQVERVRRGAWVHQFTPRPPVGLTPHKVIHRHDKLEVRFYEPTGPRVSKVPVVLVPSLINRAYVLDLEPDRSFIGALTAAGHPVYLVDWGVPAEEDAEEDVGYVLFDLLHRSVKRIARHAGVKKVHLFGYCMGGTIAAMLCALRPDDFVSLVTLATPVRFSEGGRFRDFVDPQHFDVEKAIQPDGLIPVEVMAPAFKLLDPVGNWTKFLGVEAASHDPVQLRRVLARERWLEENVPMAGAFAREFLVKAYQQDQLLAGTWVIRGESVDLKKITCPTLVFACDRDFITPKEAALPLADAVGAEIAVAEELATGHLGAVVGGYAQKVFVPRLDRWFRHPSA